MKGLQEMAEADGIGALYAQIRNGVRGILSAQPYKNRVWYRLRRDDDSVRTVLIIRANRGKDSGGLQFTLHATRLKDHFGIDLEELQSWLPENSDNKDVTAWPGSSPAEREGAHGLGGFFQSDSEVDKFIDELRKATARSRTA